jgi:basic membrane protein A
MHRRLFQLGLGLLLASAIVVAPSGAQKQNSKPLKISFIMAGPLKHSGWDDAHNAARLFVQSSLGNQIETKVADSVPETPEAEKVMEKMIAQGSKLIFATSSGFTDSVTHVASRHPDVVFEQLNRYGTTKNIGAYAARIDQPLYIAGLVAGRATRTNKLGFVAAKPTPQVIQAINAYTLGARSVNPNVIVSVVWINSWSNAAAEAKAAKTLIDKKVDVLATTNSYETVFPAAEHGGIYSVGLCGDQSESFPKSWLTGVCWDWGPAYLKIVNDLRNGTWKPSSQFYGMKDGCLKLASFGSAVPSSVQTEALLADLRIKDGKLSVFKAPLKDRDGKERLASGQTASPKWLSEMNWFVAGVEGTLPKQ